MDRCVIANASEDKARDMIQALEWMYQGLHYRFALESTEVTGLMLIVVNGPDVPSDETTVGMNSFCSGLVYAWKHPQEEMVVVE